MVRKHFTINKDQAVKLSKAAERERATTGEPRANESNLVRRALDLWFNTNNNHKPKRRSKG